MARVGRPLKFASVEELNLMIELYFKNTPREEWMITGLALALDTDRKTLIEYQERPEFFNSIKKAKTMIESAYELRLIKRGNAGDIFALKNFDWRDKIENELTGKDGKDLYPTPIIDVSKESKD